MRAILALLVWFMTMHFAFAEVVFDKKDIVPNGKPGYCLFSSIETVCNKLGYTQTKGLTKSRSTGKYFRIDEFRLVGRWVGYEDQVDVELRPRNIKYEIRFSEDYDEDILRKGIASGAAGTIIGLRSGQPTCIGPHAVILTDLNKLYYRYMDTNDPESVYEGKRSWLDFQWTGFAVLIQRNNVKNSPVYHLVSIDTQRYR